MVQKSNATVTVNLEALQANVDRLKGNVQEGTRIMAVVKADAYGHGAVKVAQTLQESVGAFAVNDLQEGVELRDHGISKPILVFAVPEESSADQYRVHNLTATVSAEEHFDWLPNGTSYHLNFDTGMGRLGFLPEEAKKISNRLAEKEEIFCTGIYSHFATADKPGSKQVFSQHEQFQQICSYFPDDIVTHIANTGATAFYDTEQFDMVRLGIGIYGYPPGEVAIEGLRPVLKWSSRLAQIKTVRAHNTVSYGAHWKAPNDGYLGIIPVGYEDGLRRNLSSQISVRIEGNIYEVVGNVTMNYCMVYLRNDRYETGTEVELLYEGSDAGDWARKLDTIPYEILTGITPKVPRTYIP